MAQQRPEKISEFDRASPLSRDALIPVVQGGATLSTTVADLATAVTYVPTTEPDQRVALQAALDRAIATTGVLEVGAGTVTLTSGGVTISGSVEIRLSPGTVIDFSACAASTVCIAGTGTEGSTYALTANASKGATSVSLSAPDAANFAFGDLARVASSALFDSADTDSEIGEIVRVVDVSGTTVTLESPLAGGAYNTADTAVISKITPLRNVRIAGGKILGGGTPTTAGSDKDHVGIQLFLAERCNVENVAFERVDLVGLWFRDSILCQATRCYFRDAINDQQAYGVAFDNACQDCSANECIGERVRHLGTTINSTATKGVSRRIAFKGCKVFSTATARGGTGGDAFDTHTAAEDITFDNCTVYSSTGSGFNVECPSVSIRGCEAYRCQEYGVHHKNESDQEGESLIIGCKVGQNTLEAYRVEVGIRGTTARYKGITLQGNVSEDSTSMAFYVLNSPGSTTQRNVVVSGNSAIGCQSATSTFYLENIENGVFADNVVGDPTNVGAFLCRFRDCANIQVTGNSVTGATSATGAAFWANASGAGTCSKIHIAGNRAGCTTPSGFRGIVLDNNTQNCTIGINDFQELTTQLSLGTGTGHKLLQSAEVSADKGNAAFTVQHYSEQTIRFNTPITADRAVTLPSANVKARFRVVRGASATGAFNINVGTGPLKALGTAGTWCDVESDGTNYILTGNGSL